MKTLIAAAVGAALVIPGVAMAQGTGAAPDTTMTQPGESGIQSSPGQTELPTQSGSQLGMVGEEGHAVIGKQLQDSQGQELGEITNVLIDDTGRVSHLVVEREENGKAKLEWQRVTMTQQGDIEATIEQAELAEMPEYEEDQPN